jgi:hypothetical protein
VRRELEKSRDEADKLRAQNDGANENEGVVTELRDENVELQVRMMPSVLNQSNPCHFVGMHASFTPCCAY